MLQAIFPSAASCFCEELHPLSCVSNLPAKLNIGQKLNLGKKYKQFNLTLEAKPTAICKIYYIQKRDFKIVKKSNF